MRNSIELQQAISIKSVLHYINLEGAQQPLVKDDGYYGKYNYVYLNTLNKKWYEVEAILDYTEPYYGGHRYWLICMCCKRKVTNLYPISSQHPNYLACRHCLSLEYASRQFVRNPMLLNMCNLQRAAHLRKRRLNYAGKPTRANLRLTRYMLPMYDRSHQTLP